MLAFQEGDVNSEYFTYYIHKENNFFPQLHGNYLLTNQRKRLKQM